MFFLLCGYKHLVTGKKVAKYGNQNRLLCSTSIHVDECNTPALYKGKVIEFRQLIVGCHLK